MDDLLGIAGGYFRAVVAVQCKSHVLWNKSQSIDKLAKSIVTVFNKVWGNPFYFKQGMKFFQFHFLLNIHINFLRQKLKTKGEWKLCIVS